MPTYEYRCEKCGVFDFEQRITEDPLTACPSCGSPVQRLISRNVNIIFKGSGFHINDYRSSSRSGSSSSDSSGSSSSSNGSGAAAEKASSDASR